MKIHGLDRNKEIDHSLAVGAKAFAMGAVVVLVLAVTHAPSHVAGDPVAYPAAATPQDARPAKAAAQAPRDERAAAGAGATLFIETPFSSTQADAVPLPPQF